MTALPFPSKPYETQSRVLPGTGFSLLTDPYADSSHSHRVLCGAEEKCEIERPIQVVSLLLLR